MKFCSTMDFKWKSRPSRYPECLKSKQRNWYMDLKKINDPYCYRGFFLKEIPIAPPREEGVDTDDIGSKEERRKKNKKIEVSELFRSFKKQKSQPFLKEDEPNVESETQPQPVQVKKKERVINRSKGKLDGNFNKPSRIKQIIEFSFR